MRRTIGRWVAVGALAVALAVQGSAAAGTPRPGTLDPSFGVKGAAVLPASSHHIEDVTGEFPLASKLAMTGHRIWVAGRQGIQDYTMRFTSSGHIDTTFRSGRPYWGYGLDLFSSDVLVLPIPDGGAYVITRVENDEGEFYATVYYVVTRLAKSGLVDRAWGRQGKAGLGPTSCVHESGCTPGIVAAEVLPDGSLRAAGDFGDFANAALRTPMVAGLTANGAPDTTIGPGGWTRVASADLAVSDVLQLAAFDASDRIYFLYASIRGEDCDHACASRPRVVRSDAKGGLDLTYGVQGTAPLAMPDHGVLSWTGGQALALLVSPSGELYVGFGVRIAVPGGADEALVQRLDPSGRQVKGFGTRGLATYSATGGTGSISAMAADGAGHLILALTYIENSHLSRLLVRVSARTGAVTSNGFGHQGAVASPLYVVAMARASAHSLVVLGWPTRTRRAWPSGPGELVRYVI
jgi:hypothetical protein